MEQVAALGTCIQACGVTLVDGKPLLAAHTTSSRAEGERRRPLDGEDVGHTTARTVRDLGG